MNWQSVVGLNRGACERGSSQHGFNSEAHALCAVGWEAIRSQEMTLVEALNFLRGSHRKASFLFFNGNSFADSGRRLMEPTHHLPL
ncbi:MAG: hypothetical protein ACKVY0_07115 [Prosthecobacter sp.]|uniref:hypothetical protein n=1 Tax=Prosthecobacter sp. TaxID=1965333 RepID=UPI003902C984